MLTLAVVLPATVATGEARVVVSVNELIHQGRRLEISTGTEVVWGDPHFERVWFPPGENAPRVERTKEGFRTIFEKPGVYHGLFTIIGGNTSGDVYRMEVMVKGAAR